MLAAVAVLAAAAVAAGVAALLLAVGLRRGRAGLAGQIARLDAARARLRSVADAVSEPVLLVEDDGQVSVANRAAARLFAAAPEELAGCHVEQLVPQFRAAGRGAGAAPERLPELAAFRRDGTSFRAQVDSAAIGTGGGRIVVVRDAAEVQARSGILTPASMQDALTGLPSEGQFRDLLGARLEAARVRTTPFSLFLLDLDAFTAVNDRVGRAGGDRVLAVVAERLRQGLRTTDVVARLGGDDFAVIPGSGTTPTSSARIARQLLGVFKEPFTIGDGAVEVSASIGIADFPEHGTDVQTLLDHAENARLAAKRARRGWVVHSSAEDPAAVEERAVRLTELRRALDNQELELFYQPVVRVTDSALLALDATVRWRHRRHGLLTPNQFIRAAEQTEMIRPLTRSILGMAVEQQAAWRERGHALRVVVHIAGRNAQDRQLPRTVGALLERWRVPAAALAITVDENTTLAARAPILQALADQGVGLAVDNFASGAAALARFRELPFTELRLDPAALAPLRDADGDAPELRGLIELAHAIGRTVTAKNVDDEAALAALQRLGCDAALGRLWGEPVPAGAVLPLLRVLARQPRFPGLSRYRPSSPPPAETAEAG